MISQWGDEWRKTRLKYESSLKGRLGWQGLKADEYRDKGPYVVSSAHFEDEKVLWSQCPRVSEERYLLDSNIQLRDRDLLVMKDGSVGKLAYIHKLPGRACLNSHLLLLRPFSDEYVPRFMFFVASTSIFQDYLRSGGTGTTFMGVSQRTIGNFPLALPTLEEQTQIARFLDYETEKIDALIEKQQQLIRLLKEKRQAVISHAVTKGLNPEAPMRDSGIPWLGEVPAHWEVLRLKQLLAAPMKYGANEAAEQANRNDPRFVRITDITSEGRLRDDTFRSLPMLVAKPYLLISGDVLLARSGATVGKSFAYSEDWGEACFAGYLIRARLVQTRCIAAWLYFFCQTDAYWSFISGAQIQATIQNVSAEKYGNLTIPVPPREEQEAVLCHLEEISRKMDSLEGKVHEQIALLQERRTALISAAVTGKIDVRTWKPPAPKPQAEPT